MADFFKTIIVVIWTQYRYVKAKFYLSGNSALYLNILIHDFFFTEEKGCVLSLHVVICKFPNFTGD